jgi:hypothetical protein
LHENLRYPEEICINLIVVISAIDIYISRPENSCDIIRENCISTDGLKVVILAKYPKLTYPYFNMTILPV